MSAEAPSTKRRSYRKVLMLVVVAVATVAIVYAQPVDARAEVSETALQVMSAVAVLIVQVNSAEHRQAKSE